MADQTIDAIKVRLGVDPSGIKAGVEAANRQLDGLGSKTRVVRVRVEAQRGGAGSDKTLHAYMKQAKDAVKAGIEVPIKVKANETGEFGIGKMRSAIAKQLAVGGGVNVPIHISLSASDAAKIRRDISTQIGTVKIYFDWVARNHPEPPQGGTMSGGGGHSGGGGPSAGGSGSAGRQQPTEPEAQRGSQSARAAKQERNRAEHAARRAQEAADRKAAKQAETVVKDLGGTGTSAPPPRKPRPVRSAPATGAASTGAPASEPGAFPGFGSATSTFTPQPRAAGGGGGGHSRSYRTSDAPREGGFGAKPTTVNPMMGHRIEATKQTRNAAALKDWAGRMQSAGIDILDPEDRKKFFAGLPESERRAAKKAFGRAYEDFDTDDPTILGMLMGSADTSAEKFLEGVIETKGGIVNRKAGARKGGNAAGGGGYIAGVQNRATRRAPRDSKAVKAQLARDIAAKGSLVPRSTAKSRRSMLDEGLDAEGRAKLVAESKELDARVKAREEAAAIAAAAPKPYGGLALRMLDDNRDIYGRDKYQAQRLPKDYFTAQAEGGTVRHNGVASRRGMQVRMVGERGPELEVTDPNSGQTEVVPSHQMASFLSKGMSHHADGFTFRGARGFTSNPGRIVAAAGMIQRVYVVNFPPSFGAAGFGAPAGGAAGANIGQVIQNAVNAAMGGAGGAAGAPPPAGGTPAAGGGGGGGRGRSGGARLAQGRFYQRQLELSDIQSQISEAQSLSPVRALSVSFGQIASQLSGRADIQARARRAARLTTQAESALRAEAGERSKLAGMLLEERGLRRQSQLTTKEQTRLTKLQNGDIDAQRRRASNAGLSARSRQGAAEESAGNIITAGSAAKNIAASAVGISVGTLAFSAAYGALNEGLSLAGKELGNFIERSQNYRETTEKVTASLGDQIRAHKGATDAAIAQAEAEAGLGDKTSALIDPTLKVAAGIASATSALDDQMNLIRSAVHGTEETGYLQPSGGIPGLTRSTGGPLGSPLGANPSFFEQLSKDVPYDAGDLAQDTAISSIPLIGPILGDVTGARNRAFGGNLQGMNDDRQKRFGLTMDALTEDLEKAGGSFALITKDNTSYSDAVQKASDEALRLGGADAKVIEELDRRGLAFTKNGGAVGGGDLGAIFAQAGQGAATPTPDQLIRQMTERILPAQIRGIQREGQYERQYALPAQVGLQYSAQPYLPFSDPRRRPNQNMGGSQGRFDQQATAYDTAFSDVAQKYPEILRAQTAVTAEIERGRTAFKAMAGPEGGALLDQISAIGTSIQNIQTGISQRGLNLEVAQYNNELRIARRSLKDAKDFTAGIRGDTRDTLGGLEGQNVAISRQLQLMGFELQQRQINYRLALAGFTAPGTTPEERQARIDEAKKEAEYAQKQLDLQKQIGANQFKTTGIEAGRSVTDISAQIGLLTQGRALTIDTSAAQAAVESLTAQQDILIGKAQSFQKQGEKTAALYMATWTDIETQSGKVLEDLGTKLASAFGQAGAAFVGAIQQGTNPAALTASPDAPGGASHDSRPPGSHQAAGYIGYHATPTDLTIGEAAGEQVYVLRNPSRHMVQGMMGGGGGGGAINLNLSFNIQGGSPSDQRDIERLARTVSRIVEDSLNRKSALLGLKTVN